MMMRFSVDRAIEGLKNVDWGIGEVAEALTKDWSELSRNNKYWARVLVATFIAEQYRKTHEESLRRVGRLWLPRENRCYRGHKLNKNLEAWECPKCDC